MAESEPSSTADFQMPSILNSMGLDYYISPDLPGFLATIKQLPEDFIVTEIDNDGKMVTLDTTSEIPAKPEHLLPSEDEVERPCKGARPVSSEVPPLEQLITSEQHQSIQELAQTYKTSLNPHPKQNILLGSFSDKDARAAIHVAVRLAFPVLETRTSRDKEGVSQIHVVPDPKFVRLKELLGSTEAEKLLSFLNLSEKTPQSIHFLPSDESKEHRAKVHQLLSELYGYLVTTRTYTAEHGSRRNKRQKLDPKQQGSVSEQDQPDDYSTPQVAVKFRIAPGYKKKHSPEDTTVKFVLYKRNTECFRAIQQLCDAMDCYPSQFSFSGTKDRRAITTQHMTVRGVAPERLREVSSKFTNIQTGNYQYTNTHIQLGEHRGNHFKIVLRHLRSHEGRSSNVQDIIPLAMEPLKQTGFVNYFGPQRFGWSLHSARVGLAMIQENYKAAVDNILEVHEDSKSSEALDAKKYYFATHDAAGALERMPSFCTKEIYILKALHRHGHSKHGYINALMGIPYKFRKLYLESVSSVVWNHLATYRMQEYGTQPVEGDLVISEEDWTSQHPVVSAKRDCVHILTSNDLQTGQYSIRDVVLPLVGTNTIFPRNRVADRLKEILIATGISLASFRLRGFQMHLPGSYRKLMAHPKQLSWKWLNPSSLSSASSQASSLSSSGPPLLETLDHGSSGQLQSELESVSSCVSDKECTSEDVSKTSHPNLEMCFTLEKSCYATVLLKELMKHM